MVQKYTGGCHCGAVRYEVKVDLAKTMTCNCSYCEKKGFILAFVPKENFVLMAGEDNMSEYRFNTKKIAHLFCKTCGTQSFGRGKDGSGKETIMINVRCLEGIDLASLHPSLVDGKSF